MTKNPFKFEIILFQKTKYLTLYHTIPTFHEPDPE